MVAVHAGYSRKGLVGVQGTSAGGLLVGALLNRYAANTLVQHLVHVACALAIERPLEAFK